MPWAYDDRFDPAKNDEKSGVMSQVPSVSGIWGIAIN